MLIMNPVVLLPLPVALAILGLLAYAALRHTDTWPAWPPAPAPQPRHRLTAVAEPYRPRPWTKLTTDTPEATPEPIEYDPLDPRVPLDEVERRTGLLIVADWYQPLTEFEQRCGVLEPERPALLAA